MYVCVCVCVAGCSAGRYGPDCGGTCGRCLKGTCDHVTGVCAHGCARGWSGELCEQGELSVTHTHTHTHTSLSVRGRVTLLERPKLVCSCLFSCPCVVCFFWNCEWLHCRVQRGDVRHQLLADVWPLSERYPVRQRQWDMFTRMCARVERRLLHKRYENTESTFSISGVRIAVFTRCLLSFYLYLSLASEEGYPP